jgi:hypothetical protein
MNNNNILKKIMIANNLKHFEAKEVFALGGCELSSSQIKAFMAGPQNKNYVELNDEQLEQFLSGFIIYSRGSLDEPDLIPRGIENYVLDLLKNDNATALEELGCLVNDAMDGLNESDQE